MILSKHTSIHRHFHIYKKMELELLKFAAIVCELGNCTDLIFFN